MKRNIFPLLLLSVVCAPALAQPQGPPKPGPEHKRLGYFVGTWSGETEMKKSDFGPGGKVSMTERCELFTGGFFLVCHSEGTGPMGAMKGLTLMGYDAKKKGYSYHAINSMAADPELAAGTYNNGTWIWTSEMEWQGKKMKGRFTLKEESPTSYSFKWENSSGGGPMTLMMEGKMTKGAGKPAAKKTSQ